MICVSRRALAERLLLHGYVMTDTYTREGVWYYVMTLPGYTKGQASELAQLIEWELRTERRLSVL